MMHDARGVIVYVWRRGMMGSDEMMVMIVRDEEGGLKVCVAWDGIEDGDKDVIPGERRLLGFLLSWR